MLRLNFHPFPVLNTSRLRLRALERSDQDELYILRSDERGNEFIDRPKTTSIEDTVKFIDIIHSAVTNNESIYWAIAEKDTNKLIGTICYWNIVPEEKRAEIGYELRFSYQGKGYMNEAFSQVISYGFNVICFNIIEAFTHKNNISSIRLLEKNHFKRDLLEEKKHPDLDNMVIYTRNNNSKNIPISK